MLRHIIFKCNGKLIIYNTKKEIISKVPDILKNINLSNNSKGDSSYLKRKIK